MFLCCESVLFTLQGFTKLVSALASPTVKFYIHIYIYTENRQKQPLISYIFKFSFRPKNKLFVCILINNLIIFLTEFINFKLHKLFNLIVKPDDQDFFVVKQPGRTIHAMEQCPLSTFLSPLPPPGNFPPFPLPLSNLPIFPLLTMCQVFLYMFFIIIQKVEFFQEKFQMKPNFSELNEENCLMLLSQLNYKHFTELHTYNKPFFVFVLTAYMYMYKRYLKNNIDGF